MGGIIRTMQNNVDGMQERVGTTLTTANQAVINLQHDASAVMANVSNESVESLRRIAHRVDHATFLLTNGLLAILAAITFSLLLLLTSFSPFLRYVVGIMFVLLCAYMLLTYIEHSQSASQMSSEQQQEEVSSKYQNSKLEEIIAQSKDRCEIDLTARQLVDSDMEIVILQAIRHKKCTQLRLGRNKITPTGGSTLASGLLHNDTLEQLSLWGNSLSDNGIKLLAESLAVNKNVLKKLDLSENGITGEGVVYLAQMLKANKILTHLSLCRNQIDNQALQILTSVIEKRNNTLQVLSFSDNKLLTDACVDAVIGMIQHNQSLTKLYMDDCKLSQTGQSKLRNAALSKKNFKIYL